MMAFTEESDGCSLGLCTWQIGGAETQSMDFVCQQALSWNSLLPQSFDVAKIVTVTAHSEKTGTWGGLGVELGVSSGSATTPPVE